MDKIKLQNILTWYGSGKLKDNEAINKICELGTSSIVKSLPNDTDIHIEKRNNMIVQNENDGIYIKNGDCFEAGAKWMREKILSI